MLSIQAHQQIRIDYRAQRFWGKEPQTNVLNILTTFYGSYLSLLLWLERNLATEDQEKNIYQITKQLKTHKFKNQFAEIQKDKIQLAI